jgi:hypothetical protein
MVQQRPASAGLESQGRFRTFQAGIADRFANYGTLEIAEIVWFSRVACRDGN